MSRSAQCLSASFRTLNAAQRLCRARAVPRVLHAPGFNRLYSQTTTEHAPEGQGSTQNLSEGAPNFTEVERATIEAYTAKHKTRTERLSDVDRATDSFHTHLHNVFPELQFPPELAQRVLTHSSHVLAASRAHNAGLSFVGRRVLSAYLQLFLSSSQRLLPTHDLRDLEARVLDTRFLGETAGSKWGFGRAMVWEPSSQSKDIDPKNAKLASASGLYKASGTAVEALVGAIYHQWGASVAHRFFHTRLLPLLLVQGGLPRPFHTEAHAACEKVGGRNGRLLLSS